MIVFGKPIVLKLGKAAEFAGTATLGFGWYGSCFCTIGSSRLDGMTFPGNGRPVLGSMTSRHLVERGFAWQNAELVGRMPVPTYCPYPALPAFEESPILLRAGDRLRMRSVERDEYDDIAQSVREGRYRYDIEESVMTVSLGQKAVGGGSSQGN